MRVYLKNQIVIIDTAHSKKSQQAFTLIEMIMVITLMAILFVSVAPIFAQGLMASKLVVEHASSMSKLQHAVERIAQEIRQVEHNGSNYNVTTWDANQFSFTKNDSDNTVIDIRQSGTLLKLKYTTTVFSIDSDLSNELNSLSFRYLTSADVTATSISEIVFIEFTLTLTNTSNSTDYMQRSRVSLRNRS